MNLNFNLQLFDAYTGAVFESGTINIVDNGGGLLTSTSFGAGVRTAVSGLAVGDLVHGVFTDIGTGLTLNPNTGLSTAANLGLTGGSFTLETRITGFTGATDILQLVPTGLSVSQDLVVGNAVRTLNLNSSALSWVNLNNKQAEVNIVSAYNNFLTASSLDLNGNTRNITFGNAIAISVRPDDGGNGITGQLNFKNGDTTASLLKGSVMTSTTVVGTKSGVLQFNVSNAAGQTNNLYFGTNTDSVRVNKIGTGTGDLIMSFEQVEQATLNMRGSVSVQKQDGSNAIVASTLNITTASAATNINLGVGQGDSLSHVSITSGGSTQATSATVALTGRGIETINAGTSNGYFDLANFNFANNLTSNEINDNVINLGDKSILAVDGRFTNNNGTLQLNAGSTTVQINSAIANNGTDSRAIGSWEAFRAYDNTYGMRTVLATNGDSLAASDKNLAFSNYDLIVGSKLDLGDRDDKHVVNLGNVLGQTIWKEHGGESNAYGQSMTSVISSSVGKSLILGDVSRNNIVFYGNGDQDSLYAGNMGTSGAATISSAAGKKAWIGTSNISRTTTVVLTDGGNDTNNFGFVGENNETDSTADVVALMNGVGNGAMTIASGSFGRVNFGIGQSTINKVVFEGLTQGTHDILYTYNLGETNSKARVDTSLAGGEVKYADDVAFYIGFGNGTKLTFASGDSNKKLNYDGGGVLTGISTIDGSAAGAGNILNGATTDKMINSSGYANAELIIGSSTGSTTLSGGWSGSYSDAGVDTLVGGAAADEFWVGASMGDDIVNNITSGDVIKFLGSKYSDATITGNMLVSGDDNTYSVAFNKGATVTLNVASGSKMSNLSSLTMEFDDGTYAWNGTEWNFTQK